MVEVINVAEQVYYVVVNFHLRQCTVWLQCAWLMHGLTDERANERTNVHVEPSVMGAPK